MSVQLCCFAVQSLTKRDSRHISFITCSILPTTIKQLIQLYLHSPSSASVLPNSLKDQYFSNFLYLSLLWCLSCNYFLSFSLHKSELYPPLIYVVGSGFLVSFGGFFGCWFVGFGFLFGWGFFETETCKTKKGHKEHTSMKPYILNQSNERKAIAN